MFRFNESKAQYNPPSSPKFFVASFNERNNWFVGETLEKRACGFGSVGSLFAMPYAVIHCDQNSPFVAANQVIIALLPLARHDILSIDMIDYRLFDYLPSFTICL